MRCKVRLGRSVTANLLRGGNRRLNRFGEAPVRSAGGLPVVLTGRSDMAGLETALDPSVIVPFCSHKTNSFPEADFHEANQDRPRGVESRP
jgi:hypothetical protein